MAGKSHNLKVVGSNPTPATNFENLGVHAPGFLFVPTQTRLTRFKIIENSLASPHFDRRSGSPTSSSGIRGASLPGVVENLGGIESPEVFLSYERGVPP